VNLFQIRELRKEIKKLRDTDTETLIELHHKSMPLGRSCSGEILLHP